METKEKTSFVTGISFPMMAGKKALFLDAPPIVNGGKKSNKESSSSFSLLDELDCLDFYRRQALSLFSFEEKR